MTDSKKKIDKEKIDISKVLEVTHWCNEFGCTVEQLEEAVNQVGTSLKVIKEHLDKEK